MAAKKKKQSSAKRSSSSKKQIAESTDSSSKRSTGKAYRIGLLGLLLFTFLVYSPTFQNTFTNWDDDVYIEKNDLVKTFDTKGMFTLDLGGTLRGAFDEQARQEVDKTPFVAGNYHPLTVYTLALNYKTGQMNARPYQTTNILLHLLNTALVLFLLLKLSKGRQIPAMIGAALFALHPMHVESVSWIAERKDVLYTTFFLGGLLTFIRFREDKKATWYLLTVVLFMASCLSKPAAVVFPLVLVWYDIWREKKIHWAYLKGYIPFFAIALLFGLITLTAQIQSNSVGDVDQFSMLERLAMASYGLCQYLIGFIAPVNLSAFYPYPTSIGSVYYLSIGVVALIGALTYYWGRKQPWFLFGMLFFVINLLLVLQFVSVGSAIIADRYTYVPFIGLSWIVGEGVDRAYRSTSKSMKGIQKVALYVGVGLCLLFAAMTYQRIAVWQTTETLFTDVLAKQPLSPVAWNNRGHYYRQQSKEATDSQQRALFLSKAMADYDQALMVDPNYALAYFNRAKVHFENKQYAASLSDYTIAIEKGLDNAKCYTNRATVYALMNRNQEALADFANAESKDPNYLELHTNRGLLYFNQAEYRSAMPDFIYYLGIEPTHPGINNLLGLCYKGSGDMTNALTYISLAIQYGHQSQDSGLAVFYYNRTLVYIAQGQYTLAQQDARQAIQMGYDLPASLRQQLGL